MYEQDKSSESKVNLPNLKLKLSNCQTCIANKTKESITSQKHASQDFWPIVNSVLNKGKSDTSPVLNSPEVFSSLSDKAKLFAENFSKNSCLDGSGISLPVFLSRTYLKPHNISVTPKIIKKIIRNNDL